MDRDPTTKLTWTVTLVPDVDDANFGDIDRTAFHYGRTHNEIDENSVPLPLSTGLRHILKESEMVEQALESGFVVEMCSAPQNKDEGWFRFPLAMISKDEEMLPFTIERGVYADEESASSMEMIHVDPCCPSKLPDTVWVRVAELPEHSLAWVLDSGLLATEDGVQTSLHDFFDIGSAPEQVDPTNTLPLPGPPDQPYGFL